MDRIFYNLNGNTYYILFGEIGKAAFLCNFESNNGGQYVLCRLLDKNTWWHGEYFEDFEEAYKRWKGEFNG